MRLTFYAGLALLAATCAPVLATPAAAQEGQADLSQEQARGDLLFLYDQIAWHASDAFVADLERGNVDTSWMRGFLVLPDDQGRLWAVFFGDKDGRLVAAARYRVADGEVVEGGLLEGEAQVPLSAEAQRMAAARQAAFRAMVANNYGMCARANPNTVVLPPDADGSINVYVLTPQTEAADYPLGGHYRFTFDAAGELTSHRRFLNSCFAVPLENQVIEGGGTPTAIFVSHLLDPQPTEIHFFVSHYVPLDLMVGTLDSNTMWAIRNGVLTGSEPIPENMRRPAQ